MIIIDTNVLSELMRAKPDARVLAWMDQQDPAALATTTITCAEILRGIAELPAGKRRDQLRAAADAVFDDFFGDAILAFDRFCAPVYAEIAASRKARGRPISQFDAQIAAIAFSADCPIATRNTADFAHCGVELVNPWN